MQEIFITIQKLKQPKNRPLIIAISGFGGAGKSTLAAKLKEKLGNAEIVGADDFIINRARERSADWNSYDRARLQEQVLEPALRGDSIRYQIYDWQHNRVGKWRTITKPSYLIVEGLSILHPNLCSFYDFKIWVDCSLETATQRGMARDISIANNHDELWLNIWMPNERDFFAKYRPDVVADIKFNTN